MGFKHYVIAATDITARKPFAHFRGKSAKECYRCLKGVCLTRSAIGPLTYAGAQITNELTSGVVQSAAGAAVEDLVGYFSGLSILRWVYKASDVHFIKSFARVGYNVFGLPFTIYSKGAGAVTDFLQIGTLEEMWFGEKVYIFDDNRIWLEQNFTIHDAFKILDDK